MSNATVFTKWNNMYPEGHREETTTSWADVMHSKIDLEAYAYTSCLIPEKQFKIPKGPIFYQTGPNQYYS